MTSSGWSKDHDEELKYMGWCTHIYPRAVRGNDGTPIEKNSDVYDWLWENQPEIDIIDSYGHIDDRKRNAFRDACLAGLPALKKYLGYDESGITVESEGTVLVSAPAADPIITINIAACNTAADYRMVAEIMERYSSVKVVK